MTAHVNWGPVPDGFSEEPDTATAMSLSFADGSGSEDFQTLGRTRFGGPNDAWISVTALGSLDAAATHWSVANEQSRGPVEFIVGVSGDSQLVVVAHGVENQALLALLHGSSIVQR